jgi:hypothetical protein
MTGGDRAGLIARIRQLRHVAAVRDQAPSDADVPQSEAMRSLEARVLFLEQLVQGLQDSVHRESERHAKLIAELQAQVQPAVMGAALADEARQRGL